MFDFKDIVTDILLEVETAGGAPPPAGNPLQTDDANDQQQQPATAPDWIAKILKKHTDLGFANIQYNDPYFKKIVQVVFRPNQNRLADKEVEGVYDGVRILDALERFKKSSNNPKQKDPTAGMNSFTNEADKGNNIASEIEKYQSGQQWVPIDSDVSYAWGKVLQGHDKLAAVALQTYNKLSVLETVKQIVKKRTNITDRISSLKSLTQPFTNLITDIFKTPEPYSSGQKKVTSDFANIVDSLYITDLISVALAAKELFKTEIGSKKLQSTEPETGNQNQQQTQQQSTEPETGNQNQQQNQQQTQTSQGGVSSTTVPRNSSGVSTRTTYGNVVGDGLNLFDTYINSVLIQELGALKTIGQAIGKGVQQVGKTAKYIQASPEVKQRLGRVKQRLQQDQANYDAFINGKQIQYKTIDPKTGKDTETIGTTGPYTIEVISKMGTTEATNLINALKKIAQYTRKGIGLGQAVSKTAGALGALRVGMGPVN